ncbi:hypothetical protein BROUX41_004735 [Berkeleyomyces rouxiae]
MAPRSGFGNKSSGFGAFSSSQTLSNLSYLAPPPETSRISDANVVVSFKAFQKKDETTKVKALEDLTSYVKAHPFENDGGIEDAIVEAWVAVYPRMSIDNSRRVRELAHGLLVCFLHSTRKRIEKHLPKFFPAWYAGRSDSSPSVVQIVRQGQQALISSPEKMAHAITKCQSILLRYACDCLQETKDSLSDERSTKPEDAEAKYYRVITGSMVIVKALMALVPAGSRAEHLDLYKEYFSNEKLWESISSNDSNTTKACCTTLVLALDEFPEIINEQKSVLRRVLLTEGLKTDSIGSADAFANTLLRFTEKYPEVWTAKSNERKTPVSRLCRFIEKGSQHSGRQYWNSLSGLIQKIPLKNFPLVVALKLLESMRLGMATRLDKMMPSESWKCYAEVGAYFMTGLESQESLELAQKAIMPVFEDALGPKRESSTWSIEGSPYQILNSIYVVLMSTPLQELHDLLQETLKKLSSNLCAAIASSLPAVSRDHVQSQEIISVQGRRWFSFLGAIQAAAKVSNGSTTKTIDDTSLEVVQKCLQVLDARNLNPFGAAQVLRHAFENTDILDSEVPHLIDFLVKIAKSSMENVLRSRTRTDILAILRALGSSKGPMASSYSNVWNIWIDEISSITTPQLHSIVLESLASLASSAPGTQLALENTGLQNLLVKTCICEAAVVKLDSIQAVLDANCLTTPSRETLILGIVKLTDIALMDLERLALMWNMIVSREGKTIMGNIDLGIAVNTKLLSMIERASTKPSLAVTLTGTHIACMNSTSPEARRQVTDGIIRNELAEAKLTSLDIPTLTHLYTSYEAIANEYGSLSMPDFSIWLKDLEITLNHFGIDPSLAISSPLGCTQFFVDQVPADEVELSLDSQHRTCSIRLASFFVKINAEIPLFFQNLPDEEKIAILSLLIITAEMMNDEMNTSDQDLYTDFLAQVHDFYTQTNQCVENILANLDRNFASLFASTLISSINTTPIGYYYARAVNVCFQTAESLFNGEFVLSLLESRDLLNPKIENPLAIVALMSPLKLRLPPSEKVVRFGNQLLSEIQGMKPDSTNFAATICVLLFTIDIMISEGISIPPNRMVFAIRSLIPCIEPSFNSPGQLADIFNVLSKLLGMSSLVYGPHWENVIMAVTAFLEYASSRISPEMLVPLYAALALLENVETIPEPNEDLAEALEMSQTARYQALVNLIKADRQDHEYSLAFTMVDDAIQRQTMLLPTKSLVGVFDLIDILLSEFKAIQLTVLKLLRRALPQIQEEYVADVILEKKSAELPKDLLNIASEPVGEECALGLYFNPVTSRFENNQEKDADVSSEVMSYLYSWLVVFEMYSLVPVALRSDYTNELKDMDAFSPFFKFIVRVLCQNNGHCISLAKLGITPDLIRTYGSDGNVKTVHMQNMYHLATHLYFLSLKLVPDVFRRWYLDFGAKQIKVSLEEWTSKYISPLIVESLLDDVSSWAENQSSTDDENESLNVRISRNTKEITAGYEIDEVEATIAIKIPPSFPIGTVEVVGTNRVGVNDKKWQSWVRSTQGVIMFSNGSIIDGLVAFKRNMVGAMKGQSECAICYAIISADKRMPDKRCGTCANFFHKTCLYKWFQTSSQNSCPLCRNPIDYLGADTQARRGGREV